MLQDWPALEHAAADGDQGRLLFPGRPLARMAVSTGPAGSAQAAQEPIRWLCRTDPHPHADGTYPGRPRDNGAEVQLGDLGKIISKRSRPR